MCLIEIEHFSKVVLSAIRVGSGSFLCRQSDFLFPK